MSSMMSALSNWLVNLRHNSLARLHMHSVSSRLRKHGNPGSARKCPRACATTPWSHDAGQLRPRSWEGAGLFAPCHRARGSVHASHYLLRPTLSPNRSNRAGGRTLLRAATEDVAIKAEDITAAAVAATLLGIFTPRRSMWPWQRQRWGVDAATAGEEDEVVATAVVAEPRRPGRPRSPTLLGSKPLHLGCEGTSDLSIGGCIPSSSLSAIRYGQGQEHLAGVVIQWERH
ncbi:unnamed protein product [Urochloa humidicola]